MQTTIYYREEDQYIIDKLEEKASRERKSKSACLLSILEEYFEAKRRIGEILKDFGVLSNEQLQKALKVQRNEGQGRKLGEILLEQGYVKELDLDRALGIQYKS